MLGRVAALRELFQAKPGSYSSFDFSSGQLARSLRLHQNEASGFMKDGKIREDAAEEVDKALSDRANLASHNDIGDEFFNVPDPLDYDQLENGWSYDYCPETHSQDVRHQRLSTAAGFVKRLHDLAEKGLYGPTGDEAGEHFLVLWRYSYPRSNLYLPLHLDNI